MSTKWLSLFPRKTKKKVYSERYPDAEIIVASTQKVNLSEIKEDPKEDNKDDNKIDEIVQNYKQLYDYDENDISVMYDGIYDLLSELKNSGKNLFMATFKPIVPTMRIIRMFKMENFFTDVYAIDKFGMYNSKTEMLKDIVKEYKLNPSQTVMIGDAETDVISARKAGIKSVGVLWGYCSDKTNLA